MAVYLNILQNVTVQFFTLSYTHEYTQKYWQDETCVQISRNVYSMHAILDNSLSLENT